MLKRIGILIVLIGMNSSTSVAHASELLPGEVAACVPTDSMGKSGLELSAEAEARALGKAGALPFEVVPSSNVLSAATFSESGIYQFIGTVVSEGSGSIEVIFEHRDRCTLQAIEPTVDEFGRFMVRLDGKDFEISAPWAITETGDDLPTRFELRDGVLVQIIDAAGYSGMITFDPTYTPATCSIGYYADTYNAVSFLDMYGPGTDYGLCVPAGLFNARNGYLPVFAFEANVANDYGKVMVKQTGGCSYGPDSVALVYDFKLPCQGHDYCYDMRKAGFSGIVGDTDCDNAFKSLMEAHCNNRVLSGDCRLVRDTYFAAVSLPGVVTDADPAAVSFRALHSQKCADVVGSFGGNNVQLIQFVCTGNPNQKFKIFPAYLNAGYYEIRTTHVNPAYSCLYRNGNSYIYQALCQYSSSFRFRIVGSSSQNIYTLRPQSNSSCWDVPYSSQNDSVQISTYTCTETSNQRWILS